MLSVVIWNEARLLRWLGASVYQESCILNLLEPLLRFLRILFLLLR